MKIKILLALLLAMPTLAAEQKEVRLITLDPGHFHASLCQKFMYPGVNPVVHVYSPGGPELEQHLKRIEAFNTRADNPTRWQEKVYTGPDFLEKMIADNAGNVVVISGNNAKKAKYILACVNAGLNVLADKPMAITPADFNLIQQAIVVAREKHVLLDDIMTERNEITTILQRELSMQHAVFGQLEEGTPDDPSVTKISVHHFFKEVAGKPLIRPPWFFDVKQQGEAIVDVTTHLVDLVQWECYPGQSLHAREAKVLDARHWTTTITPDQFKKATGLAAFPDYLKPSIGPDGAIHIYSNGAFTWNLRGVHAKVSVEWNFQAPPGTGDTHFSMMRGTKAELVIRQGKEQNYKPTLYIESRETDTAIEFERNLDTAINAIAKEWPGIAAKKIHDASWEILIPDKYKVGHEAHFAQVTERYLKFLAASKMTDWETPNLITKYSTIMQAYRLSRETTLPWENAPATPAKKKK
jgi:predicted dehydrogenase